MINDYFIAYIIYQLQPQFPLKMASSSPAPQKPSLIKNVGLAGTAAVLTVQIIHPIDVVKTRLQI